MNSKQSKRNIISKWRKRQQIPGGSTHYCIQRSFISIPVHSGPNLKVRWHFFHKHQHLFNPHPNKTLACQDFNSQSTIEEWTVPTAASSGKSEGNHGFLNFKWRPHKQKKQPFQHWFCLASRAKSGSTMTSAPKCWAKIEAVSMQPGEGLRIRLEEGRTMPYNTTDGRWKPNIAPPITYHVHVAHAYIHIYIYIYMYIFILIDWIDCQIIL